MFQKSLFLPVATSVILLASTTEGLAQSGVNALTYRVLDAEYSTQLDRIVAVSSTPASRLHVYDPIGLGDVSVALPLPPNCVSVAPDGATAVVGHDGWLTHVDLQNVTILNTWPVAANVFDIVHGGNDWAYCFPISGQWVRIECVQLVTGQATQHSGSSVRHGTRAKLHPGGAAIYGADNGLSPSDIEKYSITGGTAQYLYDSPYHGDYSMCGDLWMSEDGLRIFTRCSNVFRSSTNQTEDMTYNGSLSNVNIIEHLTHSQTAGKIFVVPEGAAADRTVQVYDYDFLAFEESLQLPDVDVGGTLFDTHGRFVFVDQDASRLFAVVQADPSSGLLFDYGVVSYPLAGPCNGTWEVFCTNTANSTGVPAELAFSGSLSIQLNDTTIEATQSPASSFGVFIFGSSASRIPLGNGFLCIDVFTSTLHRPWGPVATSSSGAAEQFVDFPSLPGAAAIQPGSTQYFQFWYRDVGAPGGADFNLSNGVQASFCD